MTIEKKKDQDFCMHCFWAYPEKYEHVAGQYEKRITLIFSRNEIEDYNKLIQLYGEENAKTMIKQLIHDHLID